MTRTIAACLLALLSGCGGMSNRPLYAVSTYMLSPGFGDAQFPGWLHANLPAMRAAGFNAVYLVPAWITFDPTPLATPRYDPTAFANGRAALDEVRAAGMRALMGLNYLGEGWAPDFGALLPPERACDWAVTPPVYALFEQYVAHALDEYAAYADLLSVMVFTEAAEGCGQATPLAAPAVALQLQTTLGSLPRRLPPAVRRRWNIGYHDYSIVDLGWGNGVGPVALPNPFDFVSMVAYGAGPSEMDTRAARFAALYPSAPLIVGEMGFGGCPPNTEATQAAGDAASATWAVGHGHGFSLWRWPSAGAAECTNPVFGGLTMTNPDGSPRAAVAAVRAVLP